MVIIREVTDLEDNVVSQQPDATKTLAGWFGLKYSQTSDGMAT